MTDLIATVQGAVPAGELGRTLAHEHLRTRQEAVRVQFPHVYDEERAIAQIVEHLEAARDAGLETYCDATVAGLGRDVRLMRRVAEEAAVRVIAGTGYYTFDELPSYFAHRDVDVLAAAFVHDIEVGIQGTEIRAAFLKCATDAPGLTDGVVKVLRAVAAAHRQTGVPIVTHSVPELGNGLDQLDVFEAEGVDPTAVMIGHCGDTDDLEYLERIASRGARLGMDRYGMSDRLPTADRNRVVAHLHARGFGSQLMLAQDHSIVRDIRQSASVVEQRPDWSTRFVFERVIPDLIELGLPEPDVMAMVTGNAHRWLTPRPPY